MTKEIEADGYITRETDITPRKRTCINCMHYQFDVTKRHYACTRGHNISGSDWRMKYEVCDEWKGE